MYKITIIGAGSIGNHLANAARSRGWQVTLTDNDPEALKRAQESIYPKRYGAWDPAIILKETRAAIGERADVVFIGTPPESHIPLAMQVLESAPPRVLVIEKPLCGPDLAGCAALWERSRRAGTVVTVGYNHAIGRATVVAEELLADGKLGPIATIAARTREHWGGIFRAHPWLSGPADSYLGFLRRGGGAIGEHSHALNIWQHFAHKVGAGRVQEVSCTLDMVREGEAEYDRVCLMGLRTAEGLVGDVIQDVVTAPAEKALRIQGRDGFLDWIVNYNAEGDAVRVGNANQQGEPILLPKTRADDFKAEIDHLTQVLEGKVTSSPISLERGLDTMMVISAGVKSHQTGRRVTIDWKAGYSTEALRVS
jgi:predicted dehydrogenase